MMFIPARRKQECRFRFTANRSYWNSSYEAHLQELKKVHHLHKVFQNPFHLF